MPQNSYTNQWLLLRYAYPLGCPVNLLHNAATMLVTVSLLVGTLFAVLCQTMNLMVPHCLLSRLNRSEGYKRKSENTPWLLKRNSKKSSKLLRFRAVIYIPHINRSANTDSVRKVELRDSRNHRWLGESGRKPKNGFKYYGVRQNWTKTPMFFSLAIFQAVEKN